MLETWVQKTWVGETPWRRDRPPTPMFWPGEFHGLCSHGVGRTLLSLSLPSEPAGKPPNGCRTWSLDVLLFFFSRWRYSTRVWLLFLAASGCIWKPALFRPSTGSAGNVPVPRACKVAGALPLPGRGCRCCRHPGHTHSGASAVSRMAWVWVPPGLLQQLRFFCLFQSTHLQEYRWVEFSGALECWIEESSLTYQCFTVCKLKVIKSVSHHHDADVPPSRSDYFVKESISTT